MTGLVPLFQERRRRRVHGNRIQTGSRKNCSVPVILTTRQNMSGISWIIAWHAQAASKQRRKGVEAGGCVCVCVWGGGGSGSGSLRRWRVNITSHNRRQGAAIGISFVCLDSHSTGKDGYRFSLAVVLPCNPIVIGLEVEMSSGPS